MKCSDRRVNLHTVVIAWLHFASIVYASPELMWHWLAYCKTANDYRIHTAEELMVVKNRSNVPHFKCSLNLVQLCGLCKTLLFHCCLIQ